MGSLRQLTLPTAKSRKQRDFMSAIMESLMRNDIQSQSFLEVHDSNTPRRTTKRSITRFTSFMLIAILLQALYISPRQVSAATVTLVGAGDISTCSNNNDEATAKLLRTRGQLDAEAQKVLDAFPFQPPEYHAVTLYTVAPDRQFMDTLEFDPGKIRTAYEAGREAAKRPLSEDQLQSALRRGPALTA